MQLAPAKAWFRNSFYNWYVILLIIVSFWPYYRLQSMRYSKQAELVADRSRIGVGGRGKVFFLSFFWAGGVKINPTFSSMAIAQKQGGQKQHLVLIFALWKSKIWLYLDLECEQYCFIHTESIAFMALCASIQYHLTRIISWALVSQAIIAILQVKF